MDKCVQLSGTDEQSTLPLSARIPVSLYFLQSQAIRSILNIRLQSQ